eukprot:CAMPEP_0203812746 /NCGR_PEP_ID=MMETSP0115-20131106/4324_1 /ASSEMBLY_ACC=CAM_ASM_000227 /TAXON_ID=33651 /ORGANISM="Bicosoecid sp, Strain ms1" /LENGTH=83 /DNA_ID=CAMNT_0050721597 /DNA_START=13 /DNA_END=260 /DNA_ORIENTATION=-
MASTSAPGTSVVSPDRSRSSESPLEPKALSPCSPSLDRIASSTASSTMSSTRPAEYTSAAPLMAVGSPRRTPSSSGALNPGVP